jgi:hypothetical protein
MTRTFIKNKWADPPIDLIQVKTRTSNALVRTKENGGKNNERRMSGKSHRII